MQGGLGREVSDLVDYVLIFSLEYDLAQVELTVHQTRIVRKVKALRQLDGHVVNHLDVSARNVDRQVQVQPLDVLKDVASVVELNHLEVGPAEILSETVERSDYV